MAERDVHVLYVVYWGALEPLGRALVLPAVKRLAALGPRITLVTFDKQADAARRADVQDADAALAAAGVRWLSLRYHKRPQVPATAFDVAHGVARGVAERLRDRPDVVHARTFVGGLVGLPLSRLTGARLIYHNEGFYPDEMVDGGFWAEGSRPHRLAKALERRLYGRADAIFSLSRRGKEVIESIDAVRTKRARVEVVPSCVDLDHFRPREPVAERNGRLRLVYVGSVGGRYLIDRMGAFARVARESAPGTRLDVITAAESAVVRAALSASELPEDAWASKFVPYDRLPDALGLHDAGFCFQSHGLSAAGGSSTKVGEYWAMGIPVIATPGLGDVDEIIAREHVGVVVRDHSDRAYRTALYELRGLLEDTELHDRCRSAAERHYGLDDACRRQVAVYRELAGGRGGA